MARMVPVCRLHMLTGGSKFWIVGTHQSQTMPRNQIRKSSGIGAIKLAEPRNRTRGYFQLGGPTLGSGVTEEGVVYADDQLIHRHHPVAARVEAGQTVPDCL